MTIQSITSLQNPRIKDAIKLRDRRHRAKQGRFLIDGAREILQATRAGIPFLGVFVCPALCNTAESHAVLARLNELPATQWHVTPEVFEKLAFGQRHEGVLAIAETPRHSLTELAIQDAALVAIIAGLEKPGNVGAVLRSADGAGLSAIIIADGGTDLYNPNCIRASLGTVFTQAVCEATAAETLAWLRERGYRIVAARPDAQASYSEIDYRGNTAIVLGSEASGLAAAWHAGDIIPISLPMHGAADSLNVSATAAVLFYEALRQRTARGGR